MSSGVRLHESPIIAGGEGWGRGAARDFEPTKDGAWERCMHTIACKRLPCQFDRWTETTNCDLTGRGPYAHHSPLQRIQSAARSTL